LPELVRRQASTSLFTPTLLRHACGFTLANDGVDYQGIAGLPRASFKRHESRPILKSAKFEMRDRRARRGVGNFQFFESAPHPPQGTPSVSRCVIGFREQMFGAKQQALNTGQSD
jgi:hypothetical protein